MIPSGHNQAFTCRKEDGNPSVLQLRPVQAKEKKICRLLVISSRSKLSLFLTGELSFLIHMLLFRFFSFLIHVKLFRFFSSVNFNNLLSKEPAHFMKVFEFDILLFKKLVTILLMSMLSVMMFFFLFIFLFWIIF